MDAQKNVPSVLDPELQPGPLIPGHIAPSGRRQTAISDLPPELLVKCWLDLSLLDRCRVAQVCFFWRNFALGFLGLWRSIDALPDRAMFTEILRRSGSVPLDIDVQVDGYSICVLSDCLQPHANRIRTVSIAIRYISNDLAPVLFSYCIPSLVFLRVTQLRARSRTSDIYLFASLIQNAVSLREIQLDCVKLHKGSVLFFPRITSVTICKDLSNPGKLMNVFPNMERLTLVNMFDAAAPPPVAAAANLREVVVMCDPRRRPPHMLVVRRNLDFAFDIPGRRLTLTPNGFPTAVMLAKRHPVISMTVRGDGETVLVLRHVLDGRISNVAVKDVTMPALQWFLRVPGALFSQLQYLTLPRYYGSVRSRHCVARTSSERDNMIPEDVVLELDSLQTLCILSGAPRARSMFDIEGILSAPALRRIEIRRDATFSGVVEQINTSGLLLLVRNHINRGSSLSEDLEILIDTRGGVQLDPGAHAGSALLHKYAGRVLF